MKPSLGSKINFSHPISKDCLGAWLFNEGSGSSLNDATGRNNGNINSAYWTINEKSNCLKIDNSNQYAVLGTVNKIFQRNTNDVINNFSIVYCLKKIGMPNGGWSFGVRNTITNLTTMFGVQIPNTSGDVVFMVGGENETNNVLRSSYDSFDGFDIWVFQNTPDTGMQIWKNGQLLIQNPKNPSFLSSNNLFVIGDPITEAGGSYLGANTGESNFLYIYNRDLTELEIRNLYISPYQMFKQQTPSVVLEGVYDGIHDVAKGGSKPSGSALVKSLINEVSLNGINVNGISKNNLFSNDVGNDGGIADGSSREIKIYVDITEDGVLISGISEDGVNVPVDGGVKITGTGLLNIYDIVEELLIGYGLNINGISKQNIQIQEISTGAVELSGTPLIEDVISFHGGISVGGSLAVAPGITSVIAQGGLNLNGNIVVTNYITERINGSIKVGWKARATNIVKGNIYNIRIGYALAMKNNNIVKTNLSKLSEKNKINYKLESTDKKEYIRQEEVGKWSYIEDSSDNVLPRIVEKRQGEYLPPRKRNPQERDRGNAVLS